MRVLEKINDWVNRILVFMGGIFLVAMMALTCSNIFFRMVWVPVKGTFELMGYFGALAAAFALGHTQMKKGHIAVDVLLNSFPAKVRAFFRVVNHAVCAVFFFIVAWQVALKAANLMRTHEVTETLRIIYYPFTYAVAFGCLVLSFGLFVDFMSSFFPKKGGES
ncbi:TRAP C4-dicarboxylate transporter [Candidatus Desulfarcum epimagneticum]|uniref:TRAP C4-dicarboxylate transporter n=1 Tax=uncultured Desulfobacteraceae bacterium TaxID=218296 RepID=A0A484HLA2_9BACT|nr:TRAP C4-dicarboxylate transporter [uncultured Desulfobacteraceae bacterium]